MYARQLYYFPKVMRQQWLSREGLEKFQSDALRSIVRHAYNTVPFYHELFKKKEIMPEDIRTTADVKKLPIIDRSMIIPNYKKLISTPYVKLLSNPHLITRSTSGSSSGMQFNIPFDPRGYDYLELIFARAFFSAGYNPLYPLAYYWYEQPELKIENCLGIMRKNYIPHTLSFDEQIKKLCMLKPRYIHYFSSSIYEIARVIDRSSLAKIKPKAVFTHAEILSSKMRKRIEDTFSTEVFDMYGSTEFDRMAWECKEHSYHLDADSMLTEFLRGNEDVSSEEEGDVVVTGFANYLMPLIRYSMGDKAIPLGDDCSCKRHLPMIKGVEGRREDFIERNNGNLFSPKMIIDSMDTLKIDSYQLFQKGKSSIAVKFVSREELNEKRIEGIRQRISAIFNGEFSISMKEVTELKKSIRGKIKIVENRAYSPI